MSLPTPKIEKFTIGGDFSLLKMKMRTLLVHQGLESALEEEDINGQQALNLMKRRDKFKIEHTSPLILSFSDSILRGIYEENIALGIWNKVDEEITCTLAFLEKIVYFLNKRRNIH